MAFEKSSSTFSRYFFHGRKPDPSEIRNILKANAFVETQAAEAVTRGIVGWRDAFDTDSDPVLGRWVVFNIRSDIRSVPPAVINMELRKRIDDAETKTGKRPSKAEKKAWKEEISERLLAKAFAVPGVKGVAWDLDSDEVWFEGTGGKQLEMFEGLFASMFGEGLAASTPESLAARLLPDSAGAVGEISGSFCEAMDADVGTLLSCDYMTWIWFKSCNGGLGIDGPDGHAEFYADGSLSLKNSAGVLSFSSGEEGEDFSEIRPGISEHERFVSHLSLAVEMGGEDDPLAYKAGLKSGSCDLMGIRKPKIKSDEEGEEAGQLIQLDLLRKAVDANDVLYRNFLEARLNGDEWAKIRAEISDWSGEK